MSLVRETNRPLKLSRDTHVINTLKNTLKLKTKKDMKQVICSVFLTEPQPTQMLLSHV